MKILKTLPLVIILSLVILPAIMLYTGHQLHIPIYDSWDFSVPFYYHFYSGHLNLSDWTHRTNEHRLIFDRLLYYIQINISPKNTLFIPIASYLSIFATLILVILRLKQDKTQLSLPRPSNLLLLLPTLTLFQFSSYCIYRWNINIEFPLTVFFTCFTLLYRNKASHNWRHLFVYTALSIGATFSSANGLSIWLICSILLFLNGSNKKLLLSYSLTGALCIFLYTHNDKPQALILDQPLQSLKYFFIFCGNFSSLGHMKHSAGIFGAITLATFAGLLYTSIKYTKKSERAVLQPWIAIGAFGLLNGATAAITRVQFGIYQGLAPRYNTISATLCIAIIGISALIWHKLSRTFKTALVILAVTYAYVISSALTSILIKGALYNYYYFPQEIALPYQIYIPECTHCIQFPSVFPAGFTSNWTITPKKSQGSNTPKNNNNSALLKLYRNLPIYSLQEPKPNYLKKTLSPTEIAKLGSVIPHENQRLQFSPVPNKQYSMTAGSAITGTIKSGKAMTLGNSALLLDAANKVIGIAFLAKPHLHNSNNKWIRVYGFKVANEKLDTALWLFKKHQIKQTLTPYL